MDAPIRDDETSNLTPSEAAQTEFSSEKLPSIEDTLQMARCSVASMRLEVSAPRAAAGGPAVPRLQPLCEIGLR